MLYYQLLNLILTKVASAKIIGCNRGRYNQPLITYIIHIHFFIYVHAAEALNNSYYLSSAGRLPYDFINFVIAFSNDQLPYRIGYLSVTPTPGDQPCRSSYREMRKREQGLKIAYAR